MNKCICGAGISDRAKWCSGKCKQAAYRNSKRNTVTVTPPKSVTADEPESVTVRPENYGQPDCQCMHCQTNRANGNRHTINHGSHKLHHELGPRELNRVTLPGDIDYKKACLKYEGGGIGEGRE
ncbi:MAG: hypothetical protein ACYSSI_00135 [Planctomycetota bacterium]|jgi:hypothetical protein